MQRSAVRVATSFLDEVFCGFIMVLWQDEEIVEPERVSGPAASRLRTILTIRSWQPVRKLASLLGIDEFQE